MRRSILLPCVLLLGMTSIYAFAQSDKKDEAKSEATSPADESPFGPTSPVIESEADASQGQDSEKKDATEDAADNEASELRVEYLELVQQKAGLMDRGTLRDEISQMERDIKELKASAELARARQMLLELVEEYPETQAANSARQMLQAIAPPALYDGGDAPTFSSEPFAPGGSTSFEQPPSLQRKQEPNPIPHY